MPPSALAVLEVTFPFFALIAAGYLGVVAKWMPVGAVRPLNDFVLYVALPCMLFRFSAGLDMETLWTQPFLPIYGLVGVGLLAILLLVGRLSRMTWRDSSFVSLVGVFPNTGFIGVPLLVSLLGPRAATPAIAIVLFDMVVTSSLSVAASTLDGHDWSSARRALGRALAGVLANPMLLSIVAGMAMAFLRWQPGPIWHEPIWMMADAASPVALFTIGAILARSRVAGDTAPRRLALVPFIGAKLVAHPLMMWAAVHLAASLGRPLEPWLGQTVVLMAALPSASNVSFLAERLGGNAGLVAGITLWTTVGAFATFPAWGWWLFPAS